jgi:hypothetical protein
MEKLTPLPPSEPEKQTQKAILKWVLQQRFFPGTLDNLPVQQLLPASCNPDKRLAKADVPAPLSNS